MSVEELVIESEYCYLAVGQEFIRLAFCRSIANIEIRFERDDAGLSYALRTLGHLASTGGGAVISWLEAAVLSDFLRTYARRYLQ